MSFCVPRDFSQCEKCGRGSKEVEKHWRKPYREVAQVSAVRVFGFFSSGRGETTGCGPLTPSAPGGGRYSEQVPLNVALLSQAA